jgi:MATE family multidrug resistance protein
VPSSPDLRRDFTRLAAVNILSNLTIPITGLVDTAMLGHLADIRFLAGAALGAILFDYVYWTFGFLRMTCTGLTAQAVGRGDRQDEYGHLVRFALLGLGAAAIVLILQIPLREAGFGLLGGETGVEAAGRDYFNARIWGAPAALLNFVLMGWFLGRAQSRNVLIMTVVANLSNIALNYVFIVRMGWAAAGAGWATALGQYLSLAVALALYVRRDDREPVAWRPALAREKFRGLFALNRDLLIRTVLLISVFATFIDFSARLGTVALAANSILLRMLNLAAYLIDGAAFACESLGGILFGRGDRDGLKRLVRMAWTAGLLFAGLPLLVYLVQPRLFLGLLTSHDEVIAFAGTYVYWLIPCLLIGAIAYMYDGLFLGWTRPKILLVSMAISVFGVYLPLACLSVWRGNNHWLWASMALFMVARAATLAAATRRFLARPA